MYFICIKKCKSSNLAEDKAKIQTIDRQTYIGRQISLDIYVCIDRDIRIDIDRYLSIHISIYTYISTYVYLQRGLYIYLNLEELLENNIIGVTQIWQNQDNMNDLRTL